MMASIPRNRGRTRLSKGSTPMTRMASISWVIFMTPISAAKLDAERPARMMAVMSTANSRRTLTPTSSTAKTDAPNWASRLAPRKAMVAPTNRLAKPMMGMASRPVRSIWDRVGIRRRRFGLRTRRPRAARSSP